MSSRDRIHLPYLQPTRRNFISGVALSAGAVWTGGNGVRQSSVPTLYYCESEHEHAFQRGERLLFMKARLAQARAQFWDFLNSGCTWFQLRCSHPDWFETQYRHIWEREHPGQNCYE